MKVLIQRVRNASVSIDSHLVSQIEKGLLVYVGFRKGDDEKKLLRMAKKIVSLRIFADTLDKMNLSLLDLKEEILVVSQFTLYGNCESGNRPSFIESLEPVLALSFYDKFIEILRSVVGEDKVKKGVFGAQMQVSSLNEGPINFIIEK